MKKKFKILLLRVFIGSKYNCYIDTEVNVLFVNFIFQRILGINKQASFSTHFTSRIVMCDGISLHEDKNTLSSFANSHGSYIQAINGVKLGKNFLFGPSLKIISANHSILEKSKWDKTNPIQIGDNVWAGSSVTILPGVNIPNNTIIGAGSVVTKSFFEENLVIAGNPVKILRKE